MWSAAGGRGEDCARTRPGWHHVNALHRDFRKREVLMAAPAAKPIPAPTRETQPYWEGCRAHELRVQRCDDCGTNQFFPRIYCTKCFGDHLHWVKTSGRA